MSHILYIDKLLNGEMSIFDEHCRERFCLPIHENFALALILSPQPDQESDLSVSLELNLVTHTEAPAQCSLPQNQSLRTLAAANPMAQSLSLLEMLVQSRNGISQTRAIVLPAAEHLALSLTATAKP